MFMKSVLQSFTNKSKNSVFRFISGTNGSKSDLMSCTRFILTLSRKGKRKSASGKCRKRKRNPRNLKNQRTQGTMGFQFSIRFTSSCPRARAGRREKSAKGGRGRLTANFWSALLLTNLLKSRGLMNL